MPLLPFAVDYNAIRRALVAAVAQGTGLDGGAVIMLEPEAETAPRPARPYMGIMVTTASVKEGFDAVIPQADAPGLPTGNFTYTGPRSMMVSFESFGRSHEEAYGVMANFQSALDQTPTLEVLGAANLAVYHIGAVADLSSLLNTAYEGRAQLDVTFGLTATSTVNLGYIGTVPVSGEVTVDDQSQQQISVTVTREF